MSATGGAGDGQTEGISWVSAGIEAKLPTPPHLGPHPGLVCAACLALTWAWLGARLPTLGVARAPSHPPFLPEMGRYPGSFLASNCSFWLLSPQMAPHPVVRR